MKLKVFAVAALCITSAIYANQTQDMRAMVAALPVAFESADIVIDGAAVGSVALSPRNHPRHDRPRQPLDQEQDQCRSPHLPHLRRQPREGNEHRDSPPVVLVQAAVVANQIALFKLNLKRWSSRATAGFAADKGLRIRRLLDYSV